jgi:hypothetical protein
MINTIKTIYNKVKVWYLCTFKGHKYNYQLGWGKKGGYDELYLCCDSCDRKFFKLLKGDITAWADEMKVLKVRETEWRVQRDNMQVEIDHLQRKIKSYQQ